MDNWLLIIVAVIFIICIVVGYVRGFLKLGISLLSTILTLVLVLFLSPFVADALEKYTPVDDYIENGIVEAFIPEITEEDLSKADLSGTPLEDLSAEQLSSLNELDWDLLGITSDDIMNLLGEIPKDVQIQEIEDAPLPQFLKDELIENNNSTIYGELGVDSFPRYVAAYISRLVLNLLSFLVTFLLAIIIVKALMFAVNIIGELPVLGLVNHIAGGVLGLALAVVEVGGHGDDRLGDGLAQVGLGVSLQLLKDHGADLLGGVLLAAQGDLLVGAHLALDGRDGVFRVGDGLALGHLADQTVAGLGEAHHGRGGACAFGVGDDDGLAAFHHGDAAVGSTKVDTNDLAHNQGSSLKARCDFGVWCDRARR